MSSDGRQITAPVVARDAKGHWLPGASPNPGGRRRKLAEIEQMLDEEHRTVENMRVVYARLRALAMGEVIQVQFGKDQVRIELKAIPDFMRIYLNRVLGPEKDIDEIDLQDAPPEVIEWLRSLN